MGVGRAGICCTFTIILFINTVICSSENTVQDIRLFHDSLNVSSMLHYCCCIIVDLHLRIKTSYSVFLCIPYIFSLKRGIIILLLHVSIWVID